MLVFCFIWPHHLCAHTHTLSLLFAMPVCVCVCVCMCVHSITFLWCRSFTRNHMKTDMGANYTRDLNIQQTKKSQQKRLTPENKILLPLLRDSGLQSFNHESDTLTTELSLLSMLVTSILDHLFHMLE